jgi:MFS family permease
MATLAYPPQRPLTVGEVLDLSFRIYRATAVKCLLFAALAVLAGQLANIYTVLKGRPMVKAQGAWQAMLAQFVDSTMIGLYIIGAVLTAMFYAAVLLRQRRIISEGTVGGEVATAARRLPALIALAILLVAGLAACFVPSWLTVGALRALFALAGVIALCYGAVAVSCAQTILLLDETGPVDSITRSWRLTAGSFWRLSLIYTVALIILFVLYAVIGAIAGFLAAVLGRGDVAMVTAFTEMVAVALGALATPFYGALALAVLADLKVRKEGADLEQRISATA